MKNIKNIISLLALIVLIASSCKKDEFQYTYNGDNYVQFLKSSGTYFVLEGDTVTFSVQFQIIGDAPQSDITMPVVFLDSAEINGAYVKSSILPGEKGVSAGSTVTISAGEYTGSLTVSGTYDSLQFSEIDTVIIQLNDGDVQADSYNNVFLLKIQKYYPYIAEEYPGHYDGTYTGADLSTAWDIIPTYPGLDIIIGEEPQTLVIVGGLYQEQVDDWGEHWIDGPNPITIYMNTDDPTNFLVEIPESKYLGTTMGSGGDGPYEYWVSPHPSPGQFNAATKQLIIKFYETYQGPDALNDICEYDVTLTEEAAAKLLGSAIPNSVTKP